MPIFAAANSPPIDYGSLTWKNWIDIYIDAVEGSTLSKIYGTGPRVRAKIKVATQISMNELQSGEGIFRQKISEIVGVESYVRVQLEYLQTDVLWESEQGTYYVALGIAALPPPLVSNENTFDASLSAVMQPAIDAERERIIRKLRYGNIINGVNVTIDSLSLFGTHMKMIDIGLDGESFTQIYLKPWLGAQFTIASTDSITSGVSSNSTEHYAIDRDAFQDLRLRFLLARRLRTLTIGVSDIVVHPPAEILPFGAYYADAAVLEMEFHLHDLRYANNVRSILLGDEITTDQGTSMSLASSFNEMEPQWLLIAMDVSTTAGTLFSPTSDSSVVPSTVGVSELTFELHDIPLAQLERRKWLVLDFVAIVVADLDPARVRFGRIVFPSSLFALSELPDHNDDDSGANVTTEEDVASGTVFDPINALDWTLTFQVQPINPDSFGSADLSAQMNEDRSVVELGLQYALGVTVPTTTSNTNSVTFKSASDLTVATASTFKPYVSFALTLHVSVLDATAQVTKSPNFLQLHQVRCALVLLLQQVAIVEDNVALISADAVNIPTAEEDKENESWTRLIVIKYQVTIIDESQRRGVRSVIFSHRLATTISSYSADMLVLLERDVNLHADSSPLWPQYLPGSLVPVPATNNISNGFIISSTTMLTTLLQQLISYTYNFKDPDLNVMSGVPATAVATCPSPSTGSTGLCVTLRFTGDITNPMLFLRTMQSLRPISSSSISLPTAHIADDIYDAVSDPTATYPAPWVLISGNGGKEETQWALLIDRSSSNEKLSVRLAFEVADSVSNLTITSQFTLDLEVNATSNSPVQLHRHNNFGLTATTGQPARVFITANDPDVVYDAKQISAVGVSLNLEASRLGGLYSLALLNEVAPACDDCTRVLKHCDDALECRALSACFNTILYGDLTMLTTMLEKDVDTMLDVSWVLEQCLSPLDGTMWSDSIQEILFSGFECAWNYQCPLAYDAADGTLVALEHTEGEQVLSFELANGFASLSFMLDTDDDDSSTPTIHTFVDDFSGNATEVMAGLDAMVTDMYRKALSNTATVTSSLELTQTATTNAVAAKVTIQYKMLGLLPLPFVEITVSGGTDATVIVTAPKETLKLRVIAIPP